MHLPTSTCFTRWNDQIVAVIARFAYDPVAYVLPTRRALYVRVVRWRTYLRWRNCRQ